MRFRRLFFPADSADMERGFLQMLEHQKTLQGMNILVLLLAIIMLFYWYSTENSKRIEKQNLNLHRIRSDELDFLHQLQEELHRAYQRYPGALAPT